MIFSKITHLLGGYYGLRLRHQSTKSKVLKRFYAFVNRRFEAETNSYLPLNNTIAGPINFLHGASGIFISGGASIGKNCTIFQQVTIGSNMLIDSKGFGSPTIGDNVLIGAGAKIIGNISIGDNCRIGANAVVTKDVPANSVVVLGELRIYQKENLDNRIYQRTDQGWGFRENGIFVKVTDHDIIERLEKI